MRQMNVDEQLAAFRITIFRRFSTEELEKQLKESKKRLREIEAEGWGAYQENPFFHPYWGLHSSKVSDAEGKCESLAYELRRRKKVRRAKSREKRKKAVKNFFKKFFE
jgi:hypothetical protein